MPYVKKQERKALDKGLRGLIPQGGLEPTIVTVGQLNYTITRLVNDYLGEEPKYHDYNAAIGVLECAKLELYRRRVAEYEDKKIFENGDVEGYSKP